MSETTIHHATHRREDPFTRVLNTTVRDKNLSFRARGLLVFMLGHPTNWKTSVGWIEEQATEGREAVRSALKELEVAGYLKRTRNRSECGFYDQYTYHWFEEPSSDGNPSPVVDQRRETGTRFPSTKEETVTKNKEEEQEVGLVPDPVSPGLSFTPHSIAKLWNASCPSLPKVGEITASRFKAAKARTRGDMDALVRAFAAMESSDFIAGRSDRGPSSWASLDWLLKADNWTKVMEGRYANKPGFDKKSPVAIFNKEAF